MPTWHSLLTSTQVLIASHCLTIALGPPSKVETSFFIPDWLLIHNLLLVFPKLRNGIIKLVIKECIARARFMTQACQSDSRPGDVKRYDWEVQKTNAHLELALLEELLVKELGVEKPEDVPRDWSFEYLRWAAGGTLPTWCGEEMKE